MRSSSRGATPRFVHALAFEKFPPNFTSALIQRGGSGPHLSLVELIQNLSTKPCVVWSIILGWHLSLLRKLAVALF
jgi:hypothetical protein